MSGPRVWCIDYVDMPGQPTRDLGDASTSDPFGKLDVDLLLSASSMNRLTAHSRCVTSRRLHWAAWSLVAATLLACGGGSPASPDPATPSLVTLGPQVLRITPQSPTFSCRVFPLHTRVTVSRSGSGWVASASSPAAGDVLVRFQQSGPAIIPGTLSVEGTIRGTAIHMPELLNVPTSEFRANLGTEGGAVIEGFAFTPGSLTGTALLDGMGAGTLVVTDAAGESCTASRFSWSIFPPQ